MTCNKDCFNCPYPDCIVDDMSYEEYRESAERDRELKTSQKSRKEKKTAAKQKAYYEAHREEIAAKQKAYYEAHGEEIAAKQKAYREAHRERRNEYMRVYLKEYRAGIRRRETK